MRLPEWLRWEGLASRSQTVTPGPTASCGPAPEVGLADPTPTAAPTPTPFEPEIGTLEEQIAQAQELVAAAAGHPGTIVCSTDAGTHAGTIMGDRPANLSTPSEAVKDQL